MEGEKLKKGRGKTAMACWVVDTTANALAFDAGTLAGQRFGYKGADLSETRLKGRRKKTGDGE